MNFETVVECLSQLEDNYDCIVVDILHKEILRSDILTSHEKNCLHGYLQELKSGCNTNSEIITEIIKILGTKEGYNDEVGKKGKHRILGGSKNEYYYK